MTLKKGFYTAAAKPMGRVKVKRKVVSSKAPKVGKTFGDVFPKPPKRMC